MNKADTAIYVAYDEHVAHDEAEAERNLMRGILQMAMEDLLRPGDVQRDARNYLLDNRDSYLYSFISICNHLNLCPVRIRRKCGLISDPSAQVAA